ncbi:hypothetical protein E2C01_016095 [Portunus trituberculatus]|uniref:Uncharacterized protein n=1 Tax=Portunus trituberculatus TaxID=210409 RepID=A0A5B7DNM6_PORTR|nr:hypothetical protein [Portunus trituberculatus]
MFEMDCPQKEKRKTKGKVYGCMVVGVAGVEEGNKEEEEEEEEEEKEEEEVAEEAEGTRCRSSSSGQVTGGCHVWNRLNDSWRPVWEHRRGGGGVGRRARLQVTRLLFLGFDAGVNTSLKERLVRQTPVRSDADPTVTGCRAARPHGPR